MVAVASEAGGLPLASFPVPFTLPFAPLGVPLLTPLVFPLPPVIEGESWLALPCPFKSVNSFALSVAGRAGFPVDLPFPLTGAWGAPLDSADASTMADQL